MILNFAIWLHYRRIQPRSKTNTGQWLSSPCLLISIGIIHISITIITRLLYTITRLPSPRSEAQASGWCSAPWWVLLQHSNCVAIIIIVECGIARFLCAMRVFEVRASSSFSMLPLCQISFLHCWASPCRKTAYSITQSPTLFDAPGAEACASE